MTTSHSPTLFNRSYYLHFSVYYEVRGKCQLTCKYNSWYYQKKKTRAFTNYQKKEIIYQQDGKCASTLCNHKKLEPKQTKFEHKKPWTKKGRIVMQHGRAVCIECHSTKIDTRKAKVPKKSKTKNPALFF